MRLQALSHMDHLRVKQLYYERCMHVAVYLPRRTVKLSGPFVRITLLRAYSVI